MHTAFIDQIRRELADHLANLKLHGIGALYLSREQLAETHRRIAEARAILSGA